MLFVVVKKKKAFSLLSGALLPYDQGLSAALPTDAQVPVCEGDRFLRLLARCAHQRAHLGGFHPSARQLEHRHDRALGAGLFDLCGNVGHRHSASSCVWLRGVLESKWSCCCLWWFMVVVDFLSYCLVRSVRLAFPSVRLCVSVSPPVHARLSTSMCCVYISACVCVYIYALLFVCHIYPCVWCVCV
jgi:hypothetical protein